MVVSWIESGWIKGLALSVVLMTLLAACQSGPNPRSQAWTGSQPLSYGGSDYGGCGYDRCTPRRICPPGHILARIPFAHGGPGRYCKPYVRSCCAPSPPACGGYGPRPCGQGPIY